MKKMFIALLPVILIFAHFSILDAALIDRGGGLIYDTDLNVTWLQDANYPKSLGNSPSAMTWDAAVNWADQLVYGGFEDWRLPSPGSEPQQGYYQTGSELGHLFYRELGIPAGTSSTTPINTGPFINLEHGFYWLGEGPVPYLGGAWYFVFNTGFQHDTGKDTLCIAWAVRDGDVIPPPEPSPVPEPSPLILFVLGLACLWGVRNMPETKY